MTKQAYWKKFIGQWERSGRSQREFCAKRGLALSTFQWWRTKLLRAEARPKAMPFVPLTLSATPAAAAAIEVELRSKTRLRLEGEAALRALESVVARIR
ncbi:MAG: hypothetical protein AB1773_12490 [Pseudomonadota bacterium]|jgi:hypothetical protein